MDAGRSGGRLQQQNLGQPLNSGSVLELEKLRELLHGVFHVSGRSDQNDTQVAVAGDIKFNPAILRTQLPILQALPADRGMKERACKSVWPMTSDSLPIQAASCSQSAR